MDVDEAGSDSESPRIDLFLAARRQLRGDSGDEGATHGDIQLDSFRSRPVENCSAADYEVVISAIEENRRRVGYREERTCSSGYESSSVRFQASLSECWVAVESTLRAVPRSPLCYRRLLEDDLPHEVLRIRCRVAADGVVEDAPHRRARTCICAQPERETIEICTGI